MKNDCAKALVHCVLACLLPLSVFGQMHLDNEVYTVSTLMNTTATLTGRAELHVTGGGDPIPGSTIHLNTPDAWLFMENILPSQVISTFLSRVRVNGATALNNSNVRVAEYRRGAVVIPQSPTFAAMEVFDGKYLSGASMPLTTYTAYNNATLGALAATISSFRLKRGYTATIATNENGSGYSRNYVAADGDLEVRVLPSTLDNAVRFVRIFPWRWTTKKGVAGNIAAGLNVGWYYNWNIDQNSTADLEYAPIRQLRWWPALNQDWRWRGSNHLLGYNEPDSASGANLAVGDAVWSWPDLLATGLRVGSPATTDGGINSWLFPFMTQTASENKRVDFVAAHYYRSYWNPGDPWNAANQFYNYLLNIYNNTRKPIWVTEWNNGANWTGDPDPTFAQQQATVSAMLDMLENAHFVERYAIYNWVEDVRRVKWDDGTLTAAGVTYRDRASKIGYLQEMPDPGTPLTACYPFDADTRDGAGNGYDAMIAGTPPLIAGRHASALSFDGTNDYLNVSARLGDSADFTFAGWIYPASSAYWQRVFDFGDGPLRYMFLTPRSSGGQLRFAINSGGGEQQLNAATPPINAWTHVAVTISGNTGKLFVNGALVAINNAMTSNPIDIGTRLNYIGKSQFSADPLFSGRLDDLRFYPTALTDAQIASIAANAPPRFNSATIVKAGAVAQSPYSGSLAGDATGGVGARTFVKLSGPAWLTVSSDGTLSGTPSSSDSSKNEFLVRVSDGLGYYTAVVQIGVGLANGTYRIMARHSAKVLTVTNNGTANGSNVEQRTYSGAANQHWTLTFSNGLYTIRGVPSGRLLDVAGSSTADGANIRIWDATGANSQRFYLTATSNGYLKMSAYHSGKNVDVNGFSTAEGANVHQWSDTGGYNQQWRFDPISLTAARLQSHNFPTRFLRHAGFRVRIDENVTPEQDSRFDIVSGLASTAGVSFRSVNYPTRYLAVRSNGEVWLDVNDGSVAFRNSATFVRVAGLADPAKSSFRMWTDSTRYLRHFNFLMYGQTAPDATSRADATFGEVP
jgi:Concanavalin A-like lectin/glucanases superfamily/Glycosyl hydrolase catalytic core/Alpha-L-arabinofuranosidase B (ABFB) domain/Ricin-type beta-trefoil lectin domain-like/Putative Ig domain